MIQPSLFTPTMEHDFLAFHDANPQVWILFQRYAFEAIKKGRKRFSARTIIHRIRWYTDIETDSEDGLKINDHWSPYYARMFRDKYTEFGALFEMRRTK